MRIFTTRKRQGVTSQAIFNTAMSRLQGENKLAENTETYLARELNHDLFIHPSTFYLLFLRQSRVSNTMFRAPRSGLGPARPPTTSSSLEDTNDTSAASSQRGEVPNGDVGLVDEARHGRDLGRYSRGSQEHRRNS